MDVTAVHATLEFDCRTRRARAEAQMSFTVASEDEPAIFDLRQQVASAHIDGEALDPARLAPRDLGGGPGADVRVLDLPLEIGAHTLDLRYELGTPDAVDALPLGWTTRGGIVFDLYQSDLEPGRYLEMWLPSPLCHDRFALTVAVEVAGGGDHLVLANGDVDGLRVDYPETFTSLSPMLVVAPEARVESFEGDGVVVAKLAGPEVDLMRCHEGIVSHLQTGAATFGAYCHRPPFLAYLWAIGRGMEYDGATTSSPAALEHETLHAWFGRGVKPASAADGWIDEAFVSWWTAAPPRPRRWAQPFDFGEPPVVLRPRSPWARHTPREAYGAGARFFAGLADRLGVDGLVEAMAALFSERAGAFVSTDDLEAHLSAAGGRDLGPAFARWVHGRQA